MAGNTEKISERIYEWCEMNYKTNVEYLTKIIEKGECLHPINDPDKPFKDDMDRWFYPNYEKKRNDDILDMIDLQTYLSFIFPFNKIDVFESRPLYTNKKYSVYIRLYYKGHPVPGTLRRYDFESINRSEWQHIENVLKGVEKE